MVVSVVSITIPTPTTYLTHMLDTRLVHRDNNITTKALSISFNGWLNTNKQYFTELELGKPGGELLKSS